MIHVLSILFLEIKLKTKMMVMIEVPYAAYELCPEFFI